MLGADEKPDVKYTDVGGLDAQKQEIREAVELPLIQVREFMIMFSGDLREQMDLYRKIGIDPPRGVLLYGPPGECQALPKQCILLNGNTRHGKDNAGQGCCKLDFCRVHPCGRLRICTEVSWRGR